MNRSNLTVVTKAMVHKVLLENKKAVGIRYEKKGSLVDVMANREVILSAGSVGSPHLLQLSGIGPKDVLDKCRY